MSDAAPQPPQDDRGVGELVFDVSERVSSLVREEIELAKTEVTEKVTKLLQGGAIGAALEADEPLPIGPLEARRSVELVTAIYTSALEDRAVSLPLEPDSTYVSGVTADDYAGRPVAAVAP